MRRRNVSIVVRLSLHNAVLVPTLWVLRKKNERKMNAVEMRSRRRIGRLSLDLHNTGTRQDVKVSDEMSKKM